MGTEKNFETRIKTFLKNNGCWYVKYWSGATQTKEGMKKFTKDGVPDILCCFQGFFLGIEVKAPKGIPSRLQIYNLKKIDEAGGFSFLLYPKDFDKFKKFILAMENNRLFEAEKIYKEMKGEWSDG